MNAAPPVAKAPERSRAVAAASVLAFAAASALAILAVIVAPGAAAANECANCATVVSVSTYRTEQQVTQIGAISGAPPSTDSPTSQPGRTSTQFAIGRGFSNEGMVVLGAAGGAAYSRNASNAAQTRWEIVVRMDDGSRRSLRQGYEPRFIAGDRVRVFGTQLESMQE